LKTRLNDVTVRLSLAVFLLFFDRNDKFVSFLKSFGLLVTFEKASQYIMFDTDFAVIRQFILDHSMVILQTDSGIPIKYFDPSIWNLKLFGAYQKPLPFFSHRYQKDLDELYQKTKNIRPISFGIAPMNSSAEKMSKFFLLLPWVMADR
jgi:hypothetical protein